MGIRVLQNYKGGLSHLMTRKQPALQRSYGLTGQMTLALQVANRMREAPVLQLMS